MQLKNMKTGQLVSLQDGKRVILLGVCFEETLQQYRGAKEESAIFFCIPEKDFTPLKPINTLRVLMVSSTLCSYVSNKYSEQVKLCIAKSMFRGQKFQLIEDYYTRIHNWYIFDKRAKASVKKGLTGKRKRVLVADMKPGELYCTDDSVLIVFKENYSNKYFLSTSEIKDQKDISYLFRILYTYATFNNWNLKKEIEREVFVCDSGINYYEMPVIQERVNEARHY